MQMEQEVQHEKLATLQQQLPQADSARREARMAAQELERQLGHTEARLNALKQLQAQLDNDKDLQAWLVGQGLHDAPRLWQSIRIEQGWEDALEAVLRERINALPLERLDNAAGWKQPPGKVALFDTNTAHISAPASRPDLKPLANFVKVLDDKAAPVLQDWLHDVYAADDLQTAMAQRGNLAAGVWLVTPQGHLISAHSVLFHAPDSQVHGILARQREIELLQEEAELRAHALTRGKEAATQADVDYQEVESHIAGLRSSASAAQQQLHDIQLQILKLTQANERTQERSAQIAQETEELAARSAEAQQQLGEIAQTMGEQQERLEQKQIECEQAREHAGAQESALREVRERAQQAQRELQEAHFFAKTCVEKLADLGSNIEQNTATLQELESALIASQQEFANLTEGDAQVQLQGVLEQRQVQEQLLAEARNTLEHATVNLNQLEQTRLSCEQKLNPLREKVSELTLKEQEARLQFEQWSEQLQGIEEEPLLPLLEGAKIGGLQTELSKLAVEISALGAVNLAALEELQSSQERKTYLDAQAKDLNEAIGTLEDAIRRIDKESRDLLMATYEEVNRHLTELFPVLFGGGEARLVLTGEEILDSGVQVMAHPPGKKNASIHLLSGGEKALTAIALVFSLFQLNPAPFCVLDEVDAPLDDTNTERLCKLIQKMSDKTQFVYISHNKITMEMAQQLVGVTMQERGVSKVVSVDIEEAMRMRDASAAPVAA
jgi:chromosome segregation protein